MAFINDANANSPSRARRALQTPQIILAPAPGQTSSTGISNVQGTLQLAGSVTGGLVKAVTNPLTFVGNTLGLTFTNGLALSGSALGVSPGAGITVASGSVALNSTVLSELVTGATPPIQFAANNISMTFDANKGLSTSGGVLGVNLGASGALGFGGGGGIGVSVGAGITISGNTLVTTLTGPGRSTTSGGLACNSAGTLSVATGTGINIVGNVIQAQVTAPVNQTLGGIAANIGGTLSVATGNGIRIDGSVVAAKVDGTSITFNGGGSLVATGVITGVTLPLALGGGGGSTLSLNIGTGLQNFLGNLTASLGAGLTLDGGNNITINNDVGLAFNGPLIGIDPARGSVIVLFSGSFVATGADTIQVSCSGLNVSCTVTTNSGQTTQFYGVAMLGPKGCSIIASGGYTVGIGVTLADVYPSGVGSSSGGQVANTDTPTASGGISVLGYVWVPYGH